MYSSNSIALTFFTGNYRVCSSFLSLDFNVCMVCRYQVSANALFNSKTTYYIDVQCKALINIHSIKILCLKCEHMWVFFPLTANSKVNLRSVMPGTTCRTLENNFTSSSFITPKSDLCKIIAIQLVLSLTVSI